MMNMTYAMLKRKIQFLQLQKLSETKKAVNVQSKREAWCRKYVNAT